MSKNAEIIRKDKIQKIKMKIKSSKIKKMFKNFQKYVIIKKLLEN
jgi:hypothetical protein